MVLGERQKTQVIQEKKIHLGPGGEEPGGLAGLPGQGDLGEEPGSAEKETGEAQEAGLMPESPGEKGLAHSCGTDDEEVPVIFDPVASGEFLKQGAVQAPGGPVVDVLETGGLPDPAFGQTPDKLLVLPLEKFPVGQKPRRSSKERSPAEGESISSRRPWAMTGRRKRP